jgi:hypothetical protein
MLRLVISVVLIFSISYVWGQTKDQDRINGILPGLTFDPGFEQYSGYFNLTSGSQIHYW